MIRLQTLYCWLLGSLLTIQISAQTEASSIPLSEVLNQMKIRYEVQFNYLESTVAGKTAVLPAADLSLEQALEVLTSSTSLQFSRLDNNFISVQQQARTELCGTLFDKETLEPLENATIQVGSRSTISDANGEFRIEVRNAQQLVTIRYLGYRTIERPYSFFKQEGCSQVYLLPQQSDLGAVILSSYLVNGIDKLNDGSFEIDISKFELLPGLIDADVLQTVQAFPGIQSVNETVSNINIRGGTHDQNLILWDDIKMYQSGHFFGLISVFNPQITQKVSLQKNGTSAMWTDGVSGTIAMKTDEQVNPKFNGNVGVNLIDVDGFVDVPIGNRSSLQVAARKSISDFVKTPTYNEYFERISQDTEVQNNVNSVINSDKEFDFYDASLRYLYQISDKDQLRLNFITINNELLFNENALLENAEQDSRESSVSQNSIAAGLQYQRIWNDRWSSRLQVYNTDYRLKAINANILQDQRFLQENKVSETGARLQNSLSLDERSKLGFGYQFIETKVTNLDDVDFPRFRSLIGEVVRAHSVFGEWQRSNLSKTTHLTLGVRYNYLDKFQKSIIEPRAHFTQLFWEHFSFEVSGEFKHQITSQVINFQNDFLGIEKRRWQLSNDEDIPIIQSKQLGTGLNFSDQGWIVSLQGYVKEVDGITTQSQGFQNQYEFVKTDGSYEVFGADVLIRKRLKRANFWVSYSYMDNQYTFDSLPEGTFPSNLDITHTFTAGSTFKYKGLQLSGGFNYHTGKPTTFPREIQEIVEGEIAYEDANSSNLDDYMRVDASALYELQLEGIKLQAGVSVWNLLNEENTINNYFRANSENLPQEFVQNSLGLTTNAVLRCYF